MLALIENQPLIGRQRFVKFKGYDLLENNVLRGIFGPERGCNNGTEEIIYLIISLYSSPDNISDKSGKIKWA